MAEWSDKTRAELIERYLAAKPTPENSMEIVAKLAPDFGATANGARMILSKANVYVKKDPTKKVTSTDTKATTKSTESKADSIKRLKDIIENNGVDIDDSIIDKLTGKAAAYFADTMLKIENNAVAEEEIDDIEED